jgi:hypothetical protein
MGKRPSTKRWRKAASMTDVELTRALERGEIANENFRHASHLHVAWVYLAESSSVQQAANKMRDTLRRFAAAAGKPQKYHETITLFWVHLLSRVRAANGREHLEEIVHEIRNCWKRISHSPTIRQNGFSVMKRELHGWNRI